MLTALGLRGFVMQIYTVRSGGCRMWRTRGGGRGGVYSHPTHTSGVQKSAIGKHLKATLPTSVLNGRVHKSYCKISELQRCFYYCCTYIYIYMLRYRFLVASFICILQFRIFWRFAIYFFRHSAAPAPVAIGMCIEFYFSAQHTDKLF